ncbi:conjugal transfer protein TraR [Dactylosporangium salmoneum]|uniref:Zinc finger DksA/TraR C4-type domain-containing protein n=1 Tax=Dactylosporangium salmoneum TaxID=53361 RepID=A0ABN3GQN9_9ACTN
MTYPSTSIATALHEQLESQYAQHIARLTTLTCRPRKGAEDEAAIAAARHAIAETARALQRMADGSYGRCERCKLPVPDAQLRHRPTARACLRCRLAPASLPRLCTATTAAPSRSGR